MESQKSLKEDWFLWLLLLIALIMSVGYFLIAPSGSPEKSSPEWLLEGIESSSIKSISRNKNQNAEFSVIRKPDGTGWKLVSDKKIELDQDSVQEWVKSILSPDIKRRFKARPEADYGIDTSSIRLDLVVNNRTHSFFFGGSPPTGSGTYLRYGSAPQAPMFLLASNQRDKIDKTLKDIREKELFARSLEDVNGLKLMKDESSVNYRRSSDGWKITQPDTKTLNETETRNLEDSIRTSQNLSAKSFYDTGPPEEFSPVLGKVIFEYSTGDTSVLAIGGKKAGERLLRINDTRAVGTLQDPINVFDNLLLKPSNWPEPEPEPKTQSTPAPKKGSKNLKAPSMEKLRNLKSKKQ